MEARRRKKSAKGVKSTPSSSSSSCSIANLPDPILTEIPCRVPIKTLTASKSVCKSWLNLIGDPQFPHLHHSRAPTEVFFQPYNDEKDEMMKLYSGNLHFPNNLHFEFPKSSVRKYLSSVIRKYQGPNGKLYFANSCNGLLCYYGASDVKRFALVWNPCTSEFITFPPPKLDSSLPTCRGYGLGFSTKANKFKLLRLIGESDDTYRPRHAGMVVADICTIEKACTWKRIGPCSSQSHPWFRDYTGRVRDLHAVFLKGNLHWVCSGTLRSCIDVHTFDFEDDHFGTLPLPHCLSTTSGNLDTSRVDNLGVLKGCIFIADHRDKRVCIWLMKEYGVEDSWTKLFCLGSTISIDKGLQMKFNHCLPITYMENGEILMKCTSKMASTVIVYNPVLKTAEVMGSCQISLRVFPYSPSLVMLKDSMLGYDVDDIPRRHAVGLKRGEMSRAIDWWKPVEKLAENHGSGSYNSSHRTGSMDHEWDQSEWSADSIGRAPSPCPDVRPQGLEARERKGKNKMTSESSGARVGEEREEHVCVTSDSSALEESSDSPTLESSASEEPMTRLVGRGRNISEERDCGQEATKRKGKNKMPDEPSCARVVEAREEHAIVMSKSSASEEPTACIVGRVRNISEERERRLHRMNKMSLPKMSLMLEMEKLKQRDKELEHRDKILDQRDKLLNILQELDSTDQSRMTPDELDRHLSKVKRYENLVSRTFDQ